MHKIKSDGSYIDKRSRDVAGMIEARRAAAAAEAGTEEIHLDMSQLYMDVVGQKKQRVYGLGRKLPSSQTASSSAASINELERIRSEGRAEARAELLQQMEEMRLKQQQIEEEMRQKQQQMAEEMRKKQEEIEGQLCIVMQRIGQGSHALPSPSAPTDDVDPIDGGEDLG